MPLSHATAHEREPGGMVADEGLPKGRFTSLRRPDYQRRSGSVNHPLHLVFARRARR